MSIAAKFQVAFPGFALDVDIEIPATGVTALFGASGSGKTTFLRCIAGLERAERGILRIGDDTWQDEQHFVPVHQRAIGFVFQDGALFPHLSVRDNLQFGVKRISASARRVSLDEAVALLDIGHLLSRKPDFLSGGEKQRVAIARALAVSPRLLLLDEPLAALDLKRKREILPYLERLHDALAIPVIYVSHAMDEVARLADHLVLLDNGRVQANGRLIDMMARLDLPLHNDDDAGVVLETTVTAREENWGLLRAEFAGGHFLVRDNGAAIGKPLRLRVLARDVSLALTRHTDTSILNVLPGTVTGVIAGGHPSVKRVQLDLGGVCVLSRVTAKSVDALGIATGKAVWVQVKSVAVID